MSKKMNLALFAITLTLMSASSYASTISLAGEMTDDCTTSVSTIQVLDNNLAAAAIPLYFTANCGTGGTGSNGDYYNYSVATSLNVNGPVATGTVDLASEMTDDCNTPVLTIQVLNDNLAAAGVPLYFNANCGPGGEGSNGSYYNYSVTLSLQVNGALKP
jgi:hypothetical protein